MMIVDFLIYQFFYLIFSNNTVGVFFLILLLILLDSFVMYAICREY